MIRDLYILMMSWSFSSLLVSSIVKLLCWFTASQVVHPKYAVMLILFVGLINVPSILLVFPINNDSYPLKNKDPFKSTH